MRFILDLIGLAAMAAGGLFLFWLLSTKGKLVGDSTILIGVTVFGIGAILLGLGVVAGAVSHGTRKNIEATDRLRRAIETRWQPPGV